MDNFIVRFAIIGLNVYMLIVLVYALNGIDISIYDYLFTNSFITGLVLTTLSHAQGKYHCKWVRFLCYDLMAVPLINFFDSKYAIFVTAESALYTYISIMSFVIAITIYLAIRHLHRVNKLKKQKNEIR